MSKTLKTLLPLIALLITACKEKKEAGDKHFISVPSLIERQVAHVDTSLYAIVQYDATDTLPEDTSYIPREKFRETARPFLELPDLSDPAIASRFREENRYDSLIRKVIISYLPLDPKKEEVKKIELLVSAEILEDSSNKVTNIIVEKAINNRDGFTGQKMLWKSGKSFLIITSTQQPGEAEKTSTRRVTWNEDQTP